jgi:dipeptidase
MCDTMVALGNATADGSVILAKNSDREPNEAHVVEFVPGQAHRPGSVARCTYVGVPQARQTLDVLLCRPFWMWGCEMGVNAAGVAMGNEAVFTKEPHQRTGLLGMDMMRLALERAETARQALDIVTALLDTYGQGGVAGYGNRSMRYHNAFIIADTASAWVLETAGKHWAARRVQDVASISNGITIGADFDLASPQLVTHAIERGWCQSANDFEFARCYSDTLYTRFSHCRQRQAHTQAELEANAGGVTVREMMVLLRSHDGDGVDWSPARSSMGSVCMHAGGKLLRDSQTTCSLVAHLDSGAPTTWVTGTSAPCLSVFKPVYFAGEPEIGPAPGARYDDLSLWWRHERLHRAVLRAYGPLQALFASELRALEERFVAADEGLAAAQASPAERQAFSRDCWAQADEVLAAWTARVESAPASERQSWLYRRYWRQQNALAGMPPATIDGANAG